MNFVSCFAILSSSSTSRIDPRKSVTISLERRKSYFYHHHLVQFMSNKSLSNDLNQLRQEYKQLQQRNQQIHISPPSQSISFSSSSSSSLTLSNSIVGFHQSTTVPDALQALNNKTPVRFFVFRASSDDNLPLFFLVNRLII